MSDQKTKTLDMITEALASGNLDNLERAIKSNDSNIRNQRLIEDEAKRARAISDMKTADPNPGRMATSFEKEMLKKKAYQDILKKNGIFAEENGQIKKPNNKKSILNKIKKSPRSQANIVKKMKMPLEMQKMYPS